MAKDSYGRGAGIETYAKSTVVRPPYLPIFAMPPGTFSGAKTQGAPGQPGSASNPAAVATTDYAYEVGGRRGAWGRLAGRAPTPDSQHAGPP